MQYFFFLKKYVSLLNKQEIFTPLGHKKSCFPELITISKDLVQIAEVTTMVFCQISTPKKIKMCYCKTLKKKAQRMIDNELKECYMKRSILTIILKNSTIIHIFFACKQT